MHVVSAPGARTLDTPHASLEFSLEHEGNTLTYALKVSLKDHQIPAEEYPSFREVMTKLDELGKATVLVTKAGE